MYGPRLVSGVAAVFGGIAVLFTVFAFVYNVFFLLVALLFGVVAYLMWFHASGRFARRLYRGVERRARVDDRRGRATRDGRGEFGAGPREEWTPPRDNRPPRGDQRRRARATSGQENQRGPRGGRTGGVRPPAGDGPTVSEAYRILDIDQGADHDAVRAAYRERVKDVHPDSPTGDEAEFKEVKAAYERLTDD